MPVASEIARTVAPEIVLPDLSVTVPEKLPTACPYVDGASAISNAKTPRTIGRIDFLYILDAPLAATLGLVAALSPDTAVRQAIFVESPRNKISVKKT